MIKLIIFFTIYLVPFLSNGQTRTITGKVIDENLETLAEVRIQNQDTIRLGTTDINGNFKIELDSGTDQLLLSWIGMEWTTLKIPENCDHLEIVMLNDVIYDYVSIKTINRKRYRRFMSLPNKHRKAHEKGLFVSDKPCIAYVYKKH